MHGLRLHVPAEMQERNIHLSFATIPPPRGCLGVEIQTERPSNCATCYVLVHRLHFPEATDHLMNHAGFLRIMHEPSAEAHSPVKAFLQSARVEEFQQKSQASLIAMNQADFQPNEELERTAASVEALTLGCDHSNEAGEKVELKRATSAKEGAMLGLPQDLEDLVLARLSISVLCKIRPVCKRWYSLLTSLPFLTLRTEIQGPQDATFFPLVFWINDSARHRWQTMKPFTTPIDVKSMITGSNGLLCLRGESSLVVLNPMTGSQREVPLKENVVHFVANAEQDSFKILCAASRKRTKVYDSQTGLWSKRGRPTPNLALTNNTGAYSDGVLYCVAREERSAMLGVTSYDVEGTRTWSNVTFFPSQRGESCVKAKLIEFHGEVFALIEKEISEDDIGERTKSLSLWRLERGSSTFQWRLAGVMPTSLRQHLVNLEDFDCVALNNRLCVLNKSSFKAVECEMSSGVAADWQERPIDSYFDANTPLVERCFVRFAFEPSLLVSA